MFISFGLKNALRGIISLYIAIESRLLAVPQGEAAFSSRYLYNGICLYVYFQAIEKKGIN